MSSDYIDRLRHELLRAGASPQTERRSARARRALPTLAAAAAGAAVALIAVALVLTWPSGSGDERPAEPADGGVELSYRVEPSAGAEATAEVLRARLQAARIEADVSVSSGATLTIAVPAEARAAVTALTQPGRVAIYDWERSVLDPRGEPAPNDPSVTGGPDAGRAGAVTKAEAEARAVRQPDARIVRAEDAGRDAWFALGGEPALTDADIAGAEATVYQATQHPIVGIDLTARGQAAFAALTRELARRGSEQAARGVDDAEATQHLVIVIDDRIAAVPFIDFRVAPDGLDGADGAQIAGDLTRDRARQIAAVISTGPLPATLSAGGAEP